MLKHRILIVDDDERLLKSFQRILANKFDVTTANSPGAALTKHDAECPFSIVISDYKMPEMNGVEFLAQFSRVSPDTVRILLTGYADLNVALEAVNEGNIFRMLQKPCPPKLLATVLLQAMRQYEMTLAERELMEDTIQKSVGILGDLISLVKPDIYGRISRVTPYVRHICQQMDPSMIGVVVTSVRLSMVGFVTLPDSIVQKDLSGAPLSPKERRLFSQHPSFSSHFIARIPRMEEVARIIAFQEKRFDGNGPPDEDIRGVDIPLGARIIKACLDFDRYFSSGMGYGESLNALASHESWYDPDVIEHLFGILGDAPATNEMEVYLHGLEPGMVVSDDIWAKRGDNEIKLVATGQELTEMSIAYLVRVAENYEITQPIKVLETEFCQL